MSWWGTRAKPSQRMTIEIIAMKKLFGKGKRVRIPPHTSWDSPFILEAIDLTLDTSYSPPFWMAKFRMVPEDENASIQSRDTYTIKIRYRDDYPNVEPVVTLESHDIDGSPHKFSGGYLCLHDHSSTRTGWDPAKSTAATFGLWSVEWIRAWLYWKRFDSWPEEG